MQNKSYEILLFGGPLYGANHQMNRHDMSTSSLVCPSCISEVYIVGAYGSTFSRACSTVTIVLTELRIITKKSEANKEETIVLSEIWERGKLLMGNFNYLLLNVKELRN